MPKFTDTLTLDIDLDDTAPMTPHVREASDDDITARRSIDQVVYSLQQTQPVAPVKQAAALGVRIMPARSRWEAIGPLYTALLAYLLTVAVVWALGFALSIWTPIAIAALAAFAGWLAWHVVHDRVKPPAQPVTTASDDTLAWCERRVLSAALAYDQAETEWWASQVDMLARNRARDELQHACARLRVEMVRVSK